MSIIEFINQHKQDAIVWRSRNVLDAAKADPFLMASAYSDIVAVLRLIPDPMVRKQYEALLPVQLKEYKVSKKQLSELLAKSSSPSNEELTAEQDNSLKKLPEWMNREELELKGFCTVDEENIVGYYNQGQGGGHNHITNFLIRPIFHVKGNGITSRHIFEVKNTRKTELMDLPSKALVSLETLQNELVAKGRFLFFGSKAHLLLISNELLDHFPECYEIKNLGWQPEGFFVWVNNAFIPNQGIVPIDEWGIIKHKEENYLIPAASKAYKNLRKDDDDFKMIRSLHYAPGNTSITFSNWASQMQKVYGERGIIGVAYIFLTIFRDIVFKINHDAAHLYAFGERSSGKSAWARSITALFYNDREPFNLNSGTDFGFFSYMQSFRNCPSQLNEFDDKVVKDEWFQAIKGIFDGESRIRGKMGARNGIEIQDVHSTLILTGQYISTKDDNSVVSRSIVVPFAESYITEESKVQFTILSDWQKEGLTHLLLEILQLREVVSEKYYVTFNDIIGRWRSITKSQFNQRIFNNWCHLTSLWQIISEHIALPMPAIPFEQLAYDNALHYSQFIRNSDTLSEFWNTVAFLLDQKLIAEGWDFRIEVSSEVKLRKSDGSEVVKTFSEPRKMLYIRMSNVVPLYQNEYRKRSGDKGHTLQNLQHYFSNRDYYVGQIKQMQFSRWEYKMVEDIIPAAGLSAERHEGHNKAIKERANSSAFVFDYELLNCDLERGTPYSNDPEPQPGQKVELPFGQ
jgi:DNA primase